MFLRCLGRELSTYYFVRSKRCCWRTQHERRKRNAGRLIYWNEQRGSQAHAFVVRIMKLVGQRHESRSAQTPFGDLRRLVHTPGTQQRYEGRFMLDDDRFALSGTAEPTFRQKEQLERSHRGTARAGNSWRRSRATRRRSDRVEKHQLP